MKKIKINKIKCNHCGDIIESKSIHDFIWCKCGKVFVDGGLDYLRRGFKDGPEDYQEMSEFEEVADYDSEYETNDYDSEYEADDYDSLVPNNKK
jgi:hypothetical protein